MVNQIINAERQDSVEHRQMKQITSIHLLPLKNHKGINSSKKWKSRKSGQNKTLRVISHTMDSRYLFNCYRETSIINKFVALLKPGKGPMSLLCRDLIFQRIEKVMDSTIISQQALDLGRPALVKSQL